MHFAAGDRAERARGLRTGPASVGEHFVRQFLRSRVPRLTMGAGGRCLSHNGSGVPVVLPRGGSLGMGPRFVSGVVRVLGMGPRVAPGIVRVLVCGMGGC